MEVKTEEDKIKEEKEKKRKEKINSLANQIADETLGVCNGYIAAIKAAEKLGVPEIKVGNEKNIEIFLKGLACETTAPSDLKSSMEKIKEKLETRDFEELYNSKDKEERLLAAILVDLASDISTPICLMQHPSRVLLHVKDIEKILLKGPYIAEGNGDLDYVFGEISERVNSLPSDVGIWNDFITNFRKAVNNYWQTRDILKKVLTTCAENMCNDINKNYTDVLEEINSRQELIKEMLKRKKSVEVTDEDLSKEISKYIQEYMDTLNKFQKRIGEKCKYYEKVKDEENKNILNLIRDYFGFRKKKHDLNVDPTNISDVEKFEEWATETHKGLVIGPNCDKKITLLYNNMASCLGGIRALLKKKKIMK